MLTGDALADRWWGHLPFLRTFLSGTPLVENSRQNSCEETLGAQIARAFTYALLVRQERAVIVASAATGQALDQDLQVVQEMLAWAARTLSDAELEVQALRQEVHQKGLLNRPRCPDEGG